MIDLVAPTSTEALARGVQEQNRQGMRLDSPRVRCFRKFTRALQQNNCVRRRAPTMTQPKSGTNHSSVFRIELRTHAGSPAESFVVCADD